MNHREALDRLWRQFVVQCESIEDTPTPISDDQHEIGYHSGLTFAAKSIRRSVDHPKYDSTFAIDEEVLGAVGRMKKFSPGQFFRAAQAGNLAIEAVLADIRALVQFVDPAAVAPAAEVKRERSA